MTDLIDRARAFATTAHNGQVRKYTGLAYITHPEAVAEIVRSVPHTPEMIAAALLHDTVEDCGVSLDTIKSEFGPHVADLVYWLTDTSKPSDGNRAKRKDIDRLHTARAPAEAQTIKYADLIDNLSTIVEHDPDFAKVYLREKALLLAVADKGNLTLHRRACDLVREYTPQVAQ